MYSSKNIIHIVNYDFGNGQPIKNRYFVILDKDEDSSIVLSVITSQDHIPDALLKHGCIQEQANNIHCYSFTKGKVVGENGFSFGKNSFIYINASSVFNAASAKLTAIYNNAVEAKDVMLTKEYEDLVYCIYKSKFLPRGIKRKLEATLEQI